MLRLVTSWPKGMAGPGAGAERLARRINEASDGRLEISVHPAGELAGALDVFELLIFPGENEQSALSVTGVDVLEPVDGHVLEEGAARRKFPAQVWRMGVPWLDRFPASHPSAKPHDHDIGSHVGGAFCPGAE